MKTNLDSVDFTQTKPLEEKDVVSQVVTKEVLTFGEGKEHIVLIDFGYKKSMVTMMVFCLMKQS